MNILTFEEVNNRSIPIEVVYERFIESVNYVLRVNPDNHSNYEPTPESFLVMMDQCCKLSSRRKLARELFYKEDPEEWI